MSDEGKTTETIEISEPEVKAEPPKAPTREELKSNGWSAGELESAEKRGLLRKPEDEKKEAPKAEEKKPEATNTEEKKPEERRADPKRGSLPDFTMTPEQEKVFLETFGAGTAPRAMYFRMKNERHARQASEARIRELEARLNAVETKPIEKKLEVDENGNEIDPDDKPLTARQLREMREKEAEEQAKQHRALQEQAQRVTEAQRTQEEYARAVLPDFDATVTLAKDVMQNLDVHVPEKWKQAKVIELIQKLQVAAANADRLGIDDYHAAFIAHEIGQFHPNYGKTANGERAEDIDGNSNDPNKANGGQKHTPEQMKRIEANTQRRASSASLPGGGGKRSVSVDEVGLAELNRMSLQERQRFKEKHPERYAKLLRG